MSAIEVCWRAFVVGLRAFAVCRVLRPTDAALEGEGGGRPVRRAPWGGVGDGDFRLMVLRALCIDSNDSGCVGMLSLCSLSLFALLLMISDVVGGSSGRLVETIIKCSKQRNFGVYRPS